jgi:hypothetical protein
MPGDPMPIPRESLQFLTTQADRLSNTVHMLEQYYERMQISNAEVVRVLNETRAELKIVQRILYEALRQI